MGYVELFIENWRLLVSTAIIGAFVAKLVLASANKQMRRTKLGFCPPQVSGWLPLSIDLAISGMISLATHQFFEWTRTLFDTYGSTVEVNAMGMKVLLTEDPENIKAIQMTQFSDFPKGELQHKIFAAVLQDSVFATDGEAWINSKKQLSTHLARVRPEEFDETESHYRKVLTQFKTGKVFDVYDIVDRYQLDLVSCVYMGTSPNSIETGVQPIRWAMDTLLRTNVFRQWFGELGVLVSEKILCPSAVKQLDLYLDSLASYTLDKPIGDIEKIPQQKRNLVEHLAVQRLGRKALKDQLIAVILAAKDPTAITIAWACFELARKPDIYAELRKEIIDKIGNTAPPDLAQLKSIKMLRAIVQETMRLYHPLGMNLRSPPKDTTLPRGGGPNGDLPVAVLAGTQVIYSVISHQRRESAAGRDPESWKPHRWLDWQPDTWDYVPFNHGPRVCLGRNFGQMQVEYFLARTAQEFERIQPHDFDKYPGGEQRIKLELNTKAAWPIKCSFH
ncbi:cytochrome P450 [Rhexocercosporidium sp. MPI-PUGE-AT-0058]|nr:cytochrome P450 [Rhexocercosporidium sp. MPI-PUGE-AT-0058]